MTDKKDLQIMELLASNCRLPHATIAQSLNLSKDAVAYRINKLEQTDLINQYMMFIDARRLGFTRYHILIRFDADIEDKDIFIKKASNHKFVMWINSFIGKHELQIIVDAKDGFHLNQIREELFKLCNHQIREYFVLTHIADFYFTNLNQTMRLNTKFAKKSDHSFSSLISSPSFAVNERFDKYDPSHIETDILKILSDNPKESLIDIGKELHIDRSTVKKKITNLIEKKIILNFGGIANHREQGFVTYYMMVRLSQETPLEVIRKPFEKLTNIFYAGKMIGEYDMILYLNARNPEELSKSIDLFKKELGNHITYYDLLVQDKVHYWKQFTKGIYDELMK